MLGEQLQQHRVRGLPIQDDDAFDTAFDVYFSTIPQPDTSQQPEDDRFELPPSQGGDVADTPPFDLESLLDDLLQALTGLDEEAMRRGVRTAVDELAGMEPGRPVGGTYYLYRTLRRLDLADLEQRLIDALMSEDLSEFDRRLLREEVEARLEQLRQEIEEEIRRRLVADRGRDAVARTLRRPLIEDIDLMHATTRDLHEMEAAIEPLTRKLAARLAPTPETSREARLQTYDAQVTGDRWGSRRAPVPSPTATPSRGLASL